MAVITRSMGLSVIFRPRSATFIAPVCKVKMVHVPVKLASGMLTGWFVTLAITVPALLVTLPVIVPTALMTPFVRVKVLVVKFPVNVPTFGITCIIVVVSEPTAG